MAYPRCTGGRRAAPEGCGGIRVFDQGRAGADDAFDADNVSTRLASLAVTLFPVA